MKNWRFSLRRLSESQVASIVASGYDPAFEAEVLAAIRSRVGLTGESETWGVETKACVNEHRQPATIRLVVWKDGAEVVVYRAVSDPKGTFIHSKWF